MSDRRPPPRCFAIVEFLNNYSRKNQPPFVRPFSSARLFPHSTFQLHGLRFPSCISYPVSFSIVGAFGLRFVPSRTSRFGAVSRARKSSIPRFYPRLLLWPTVSSPNSAVHRLATSLYDRFPRFSAMASVRPDCRPSKTFVSSLLSFRQAALSFPAVRTVAFAFHSVFFWILLVCRLKYVRISSKSGLKLETRAPRNLSPEGANEEGLQQSVTPLPTLVPDVSSRRALAFKLRSLKKSDENVSCWQTHLFLNSRRQTLFTQSWILANGAHMKGILVLLHGLNEHSGRYVNFAEQLNARGYGVYAMDWIGHGGSDGLHGYVASLDHVVADTKAFLHWVKDRNPGVPCFLFGHSTGGAIILKAALHPSVEAMLEGVILTSPALRVQPAHPVFRVIAPVFSVLVPTLQFKGASKKGIPVTRDAAELAAKYADPLVYTGPIRVRTGSEILRITAYLQKKMKIITVPFFVLHGNADTVTDPLASQDLYKHAASKHKRIKLYDGCLHDLLFDLEKEEIMKDILTWMDERLNIC